MSLPDTDPRRGVPRFPLARPSHAVALLLAFLVAGLGASVANAAEHAVRLGILQFGTVGWEVDVIAEHDLAGREGVDLRVVPLASTQSAAVALQGGAVDVIVSDWIWVARQRHEGRRYTFVPYSLMVGSLLVDPKLGIEDLAGLRGRKVGVAGGPVDKSWLLLRAYSRQTVGEDLANIVEPTFGAPPLLNELARRGDLAAVLNYWHFAARLRAGGMTELVRIDEVLRALGIEQAVPLLGWVFDEDWANENADTVRAFLRADYAAKHLLLASDEEWRRLRPRLKADDDATATALRDTWRDGVPAAFGAAERDAAARLFEVLVREGGSELVGESRVLPPGTFWDGFAIPPWTR